MNRRNFIWTGLIFVPTYFSGKKLIAQELSPPTSLRTAGLIGRWSADYLVGGKLWDSSGFGNHGTMTGGIALANDAHRGRALSLDGTDDYVDLGTATPPDALTWSIWFKASSIPDTAAKTLLGSIATNGESGTQVYFYGVIGTLQIRYAVFNSFGQYMSWDVTTPSPAVANGLWQLLVLTQSSPSVAPLIYVNTVSQTVVAGLDIGANPTRLARPFSIGRAGGSSAGYFIGSLDEVSIYNRVLSPGEINILYHQ